MFQIEFWLEQQGLAPMDLVPVSGSESRVSEVLSGKRASEMRTNFAVKFAFSGRISEFAGNFCSMVVTSVISKRSGNFTRFEARGRTDGGVEQEFEIRFDFNREVEPPEAAGDPWLAALLLPAMFAEEDLEIRAPVSRRLTRSVVDVQNVFRSWYPDFLKCIKVRTPTVVETPCVNPEKGPRAVFFSGGVDSWYSLHKHREDLAGMLTVKGFDLPFRDEQTWPHLVTANREIASEYGLELVTVETNLRDKLDPGYSRFKKRYAVDFWGQCMHGAGMAAVGLFLQNRFPRVIIPASMEYSYLPPWGSHPILDPLWSNGRVSFRHDGCEELRLGKLRVIAGVDTALKHLRVCPACVPGRYNCCECEKCWRTMMTLRLFGVLDRATSFDQPLDLARVESMPLLHPIYHPTYREILEEASRRGDQEIIRIVRILIGEQFSPRHAWPRFRETSRSVANQALRKIGVPRWKRSILKRLPGRRRQDQLRAEG